jgi:cell division cycle 20-like protein 1, cofactor of APC complex
MFSKSSNEIVSTHGYSLNQIILWKYPTMQKVATLTGHTYRVLYLSMSPDGQNIVTGAGDETLRFWSAFPSLKGKSDSMPFGGSSSLFPSSMDIRWILGELSNGAVFSSLLIKVKFVLTY